MLTKIINSFLIIFGFLVLFGFSTNNVSAQCTQDCVCVQNGSETYGTCSANNGGCENGPIGAGCSCTIWGPSCGGNQCTSNSQCGNNQVCCQGQCVGQGQCGGGGNNTCPWTQVNCPSGTQVNWNQPVSANFQARISSCPGPGSAQRIVSVGGTTCASGLWVDTDVCQLSPGGVEQCEAEFICRANWMRTYACVNLCTSTSPSTPTLLSPADSSTVSTESTSLMWNNLSQTWGTGCPTNNNQFEIYVGTNPASLGLLATVGSGVGSVPFTGTSGQT